MSQRTTRVADDRIESKIYVVVEAGPAAADRLAAALSAGDVSSVLIAPPPGGTLDVSAARPLVEMAQKAGAAALISGDAELARTLRADGVHLGASPDMTETYEAARAVVGGRFIVGADTGGSRDEAMTLAEIGADYVAFAPIDGDTAARDELCEWWAEIFEIPCVALGVESADAAVALQAARCDFVGLHLPSSAPPAEARDLVAGIRAALKRSPAEAT
jgi:thiamine-phosphate pyrophosphorylase